MLCYSSGTDNNTSNNNNNKNNNLTAAASASVFPGLRYPSTSRSVTARLSGILVQRRRADELVPIRKYRPKSTSS